MHLRDFPTAAVQRRRGRWLVGVVVAVAVLADTGAARSQDGPTVPVVPVVPAGDAVTAPPVTATQQSAAVAESLPATSVAAITTTTKPRRTVLLQGRGFGHGRGLGQWGAYGYAKDYGWNYRRILDHYYGGTVVGQISPRSAIGVRLIGFDAKPIAVFQPKGRLYTAPEGQVGFTLPPGLAAAAAAAGPLPFDSPAPVAVAGAGPDGGPVEAVAAGTQPGSGSAVATPLAATPPLLTGPPAAVRLQLVPGGFQVSDGPTCAGPWSVRPGLLSVGSVTITAGPADPVAGADDPDAMLQLCTPKGRQVYRGDLLAADGKPGQRTVNIVGVDAYLRSVVPREVSSAWGDQAPEAVKAQAVAARSYAAAERRNGYSNTCDTIACQVYSGRGSYDGKTFKSLEDPRTDRAIAATANEVRVNPRTGAPIRTEFSASTGGHTAPGDFPPVPDAGDATAPNPNKSWTVRFPASRFESAKLGTLTDIKVTKRDGSGEGGGRATVVTLTYTSGIKTRTGAEIMSSFGLKSSWFDAALVADGQTTVDTIVDASAALTGDAGIVAAAAAGSKVEVADAVLTNPTATKPGATKPAGKRTSTKRTTTAKTPARTATTIAVVAVAAGAAPVNTVDGGAIAGAPTTTKPAPTKPTSKPRKKPVRTTRKRR